MRSAFRQNISSNGKFASFNTNRYNDMQRGRSVSPPAYGLASVDEKTAVDEKTTVVAGKTEGAVSPPLIQAELAVGAPGDLYEQEAERVAEQVMGAPQPLIQQQCKCGGVCPRCTTNPILQTKEVSSSVDCGSQETAPPLVQDVLKTPGSPMDSQTRTFMESRFGGSFSDVRIHTDSTASDSADAVNARAYTVGKDVVFAAGQYSPNTYGGKQLLAHELTHVRQQSSRPTIIQRRRAAPNLTPATNRDRKEFVESTIRFFTASADFYAEPRVTIDQALFERLINNWHSMVVDREQMIDNFLSGDVLLKRELHDVYKVAIRVLMSRTATAFNRSEDDLYRENSGRIPMWAWQTAHRMEAGFSTPIAEGRSVDPLTGNVDFSLNGFGVKMLPNTRSNRRNMRNRAETELGFSRVLRYRHQGRGRRARVIAITTPAAVSLTIQTTYGSGVTAASQSGYGRGTTPEDIASGAVNPRSRTLGFHEGAHGLAFIEFIAANPAPQFAGTVGMSLSQFSRAIRQWVRELNNYVGRAETFSLRHVDCVGTTLDQFNAANVRRGARVRIQCPP